MRIGLADMSFSRIPTIEEAMQHKRQTLCQEIKYINAWHWETRSFSLLCLIFSYESGELGTCVRWAVFTKDPFDPGVQITGGVIGFEDRA